MTPFARIARPSLHKPVGYMLRFYFLGCMGCLRKLPATSLCVGALSTSFFAQVLGPDSPAQVCLRKFSVQVCLRKLSVQISLCNFPRELSAQVSWGSSQRMFLCASFPSLCNVRCAKFCARCSRRGGRSQCKAHASPGPPKSRTSAWVLFAAYVFSCKLLLMYSRSCSACAPRTAE